MHEGIDSCLVIRGFDSTYEAQYKQLTVSYPTQKSGELQCLPIVVLEEISSCSILEHDPFHPVIYQVLLSQCLYRSDGTNSEWKALIDAGINDWGGVSPVTKDWVNPEVILTPI